MKKKAVLSVLMAGAFLLLCLIPSVGMLTGGPSPLLANETAPRTPSLKTPDGRLNENFLSEIADYVGTRFALRPAMVSARSYLFEKLFHSSAEEQVVLGRGAEMYYASTLNDYCGVSLSEDELHAVVRQLKAIQETVEGNGGRFLFTVAPNKNTVAPGGMPDRFPAGHAQSNLARIVPMLEEAGIPYVDLQAVLQEGAVLYYKTDSHWTARGAALAQKKDSTISKLRSELDETVREKSAIEARTSNRDAKIERLEKRVEAATAMVAQYQKAYIGLYANALGVDPEAVQASTSTSVKELQSIIASTQAGGSRTVVESGSIDIVDDQYDGLVTV